MTINLDHMNRRDALAALIASGATVLTPAALAQSAWPAKPIRIIVPFAAGVSPDIVARIVGEPLSRALGQPILIDNRAGASGMIGAELAAKSPADGYTIFLTVESIVGVLPHIYSKQSYNHFRDFTSLTKIVTVPYYLVTNPNRPYQTVKDLLEDAKKRPGAIDYGSLGIGSGGHVRMEMLNNMAGTRMAHIPYKGSPMADLMAGQLSVAFEPATTAIPLIRSGKLRALAVTSTVREPALPEVPPAADSVPGFSADGWQGFVVPAGTPPAITARLNAEIAKVLALSDVQSRLRDLGLHPVGNSVADFSANMKAEFDKWGKVARDNDIRVE